MEKRAAAFAPVARALEALPQRAFLLDGEAVVFDRHGVSLSELVAELDGEDLDRVLYALAVVKGRQGARPGSPDDLWIPAAEPDP